MVVAPFNLKQLFIVIFYYYILIYNCLFSEHFLLDYVVSFLKTVDPTTGCKEVFYINLFSKMRGFFFDQRPTNGYFLGTNYVQLLCQVKFRNMKRIGFKTLIFNDFLYNSADAFSISACSKQLLLMLMCRFQGTLLKSFMIQSSCQIHVKC